MAAGSSSLVIDYTSLDYSSMLRDLETFAQKQFPGEQWTDFNSSQFAKHLAEMMAYATDVVAYQANACVLETVIETLIREKNFRKIAKIFSYSMLSARPSSSDSLRIYNLSADSLDYPLTLSELQRFEVNGVVFQPYATTVVNWPPLFDVGTYGYYVDIPVIQGETVLNYSLGTSSGQPNQSFTIPDSPIIDGTISINVNGVDYTKITNAVEAGPSDRTYLIETDELQVTRIIFGDAVNGAIPPITHTVYATYDVGGGSGTNFPAGTALEVDVALPGTDALIGASAVFMAPAIGGGARQTLLEAKRALPAVIKTNDRCVTDEDYAAEALLVPGVFKTAARPGIPIGGSTPVLLFVVPQGLGNPSSALANQIITTLKPKRMSGKRIYVRDPNYVRLVVEADAHVNKGVSKYVARQRVIDAVMTKYQPSFVDFGQPFGLQDLYDSTGPDEIEGISKVFYRKFTVWPHYGRYVGQPTSGNGSVTGIEVNWPTVQRREWSIEVLAPDPTALRFNVYQRIPGTISTLSDTSVFDSLGAFQPNQLVGWNLHPLPEELSGAYVWPITANSDQAITVGTGPSGLLTYAQPDDPYVAEKLETDRGKILRSEVVYDSAGTLVFVDSSLSWESGDLALLTPDSGGETSEHRVSSVITSVDVINDGSMEDPGVTAWTPTGATRSKDTGTFYTGTRSLKVLWASGSTPRVTNSATLTVGYRYTITGFALSDGGRLPQIFNGGTSLWISPSLTGWQEYSVEFTATATTLEFGFNAGTGHVFFDTVTVMRTPALVLADSVTVVEYDTLDYVWESADGTVRFAVVAGSTPFAIGDRLYVDTYPAASDLNLRKEDFPTIATSDVTVYPIGGV